jgi:WhiB family redox-sensing transcriptional regulator
VTLRRNSATPFSEVAVTELSSTVDGAELADIFGLPEEASWQERALCAQTDPEAFFPEKGGSTREAKRICSGCEVRAECLEYALEHDERFGIWGGLSERERRRLKRRAV